ncbi:MAG: DMT family transporter, partial [Ectothiorhodospiraceae bacterium]
SLATLSLVLAVQGRLMRVLEGRPRDYRRSLVLGFLNPFLYYVVLFEAYDRLPAQEAQPLNYTWALTLALLSIPLLRQRITRWDLAGGLLAYSGVWVIATHGRIFAVEFADPVGVLLALGSTIIWSLYWIFSVRDTREPLVALLVNFAFGLPFIAVACLLTSGFAVPVPGLLGAAYVGVFEMGLAFACWLTALTLTSNASRVGNLIFLSPFLSLVFIHFLVGETILMSTYVGLALIIAGLIAQQLKARQQASGEGAAAPAD